MKESSTLAENAVINLLQREIMPDTKMQCTNKSNTLVCIVINNLIQRVISEDTKRICIMDSRPV